MSHTSRFMCFLYIVLLINLILEINGQEEERKGPPGNRGDTGARGERGEKGEKGEVGPYGKNTKLDSSDDDSLDRSYEPGLPSMRGTVADYPATSCRDEQLDVSTLEPDNDIDDNIVSVYIYDAKPFKVNCDKNELDKTCLMPDEKPKSKREKKFDGYEFPEAGKPFWLSTIEGFDLLGFYKDFKIKHISQLKYLLNISYKVSIEIVVHCKNTVISKDSEKYLQIHLWDGQNVGPYSTLKSPAHYEIPDELNKCKDFTDENTWGTATIRLTISSNFIKDFYIRDIQKGKNQAIYIELKELCIYN